MSGFDVEAVANGLVALILTIPSVEEAQIGAPESGNMRIGTWVTIGDPGVIEPDRAGGVYKLPINLIAWYRYTVEANERAAEAGLADWVTELTRRLIQNRIGTVDGVTRNLNGTCDRMDLPQAAAGVADYTLMAGAEQRVYPLGIRVVQLETIT